MRCCRATIFVSSVSSMKPELDETVADPHAALRLLLERARELLLGDEPLADEQLADSILESLPELPRYAGREKK